MRGISTLVFGAVFCLSSFSTAAALDSKLLGQEMAAVMRSLDILMAREEMKGTLSTRMVGGTLRSFAGDPSPEVTKKMAMIVESSSISQCLTRYEEKKSPSGVSGEVTEFDFEYAGPDCPFSLVVKGKIEASEAGLSGDVLADVTVISPVLKSQFELEKLRLPMHLDVTVGPTAEGFGIVMKGQINSELVTSKWGTVSFVSNHDSTMTFGGSGFKSKNENHETYAGAGATIQFAQRTETDNAAVTETYWVNGVVVPKDEFIKQHQAITVPGFSQDKVTLAQPHVCLVSTFDSSRFTVDQIRTAIRNNSIVTVPTAEILPIGPIFETGNQETVVTLFGQPTTSLEYAVTQDVIRFRFQTQDKRDLGSMTALLGDHVDITKLIDNRVVRIVCDPK